MRQSSSEAESHTHGIARMPLAFRELGLICMNTKQNSPYFYNAAYEYARILCINVQCNIYM